MNKPNIDRKIKNLIDQLNLLHSNVSGHRFWLDLRLVILLCSLFCEYLISLIYKHKKIIKEKFKDKTTELENKDIISQDLKKELDELYKARNAIAHNLTIIGKINNINPDFLDINTAKSKGIKCLIGLLQVIDKEESKE